MEYLDVYDENGNYVGKETRNIVHTKALWHNTVHCWLYDFKGNVYFQIRKDEGTFYTTASGHILAGESIKEGFGREIKEEIGIDIDYEKAVLVNVNKFVMDKVKKDGSIFKDRAFANVYVCLYGGNDKDFNFDINEVDGLIKVNALETLELLNGKIDNIVCKEIKRENDKIIEKERVIYLTDFLVCAGEIASEKYGTILEKVISLTN